MKGLFFLSFAPLWLCIIISNTSKLYEYYKNKIFFDFFKSINGISTILIIILFIIHILILFLNINSGAKKKYEILNVKQEKNVVSQQILTYVIPLFAFNFSTVNGWFNFLIFYFVLWYLNYKYNYVSINIILEIIGFSQYICTVKQKNYDTEFETIIISNKDLRGEKGNEISLVQLNDDYYLNTKQKEINK